MCEMVEENELDLLGLSVAKCILYVCVRETAYSVSLCFSLNKW